MAVKKNDATYGSLVNELKRGVFRPIYLLMGEEAFYIDDLEKRITDAALSEDERDFNLTVTYGVDIDARELVAQCRRYPVMAERQVVVLREAQNVASPDAFKFYAERPTPTTVLVICCKGGNFKSAETIKTIRAGGEGVVMESRRLTEANAGRVIEEFAHDHGLRIDPKAVAMMRDYVGVDVSRLAGEMGKLVILLNVGDTITPEMIEQNIGISKDYNNFELEAAIRSRNALKAFKIVDYFAKNPKKNPSVTTVGLLFSFFSTLLLAHTARDKSESGIMEQIETKSPYRARSIIDATRNFSTAQCVNAIAHLRQFDRKVKGIASRQNEYELLRELIFNILYCS